LRLRTAAVAALLPLLMACSDHSEKPAASQPQPQGDLARSRDPYALGSTVDLAGAVPEDAEGETFVHGGLVFLSVHLDGASTDQALQVDWVGPNGKVLHHEERAVGRGASWAAFSSGTTNTWPDGEHHAVVRIDGRKVSEKAFTLLGARPSRG
jgi:hypothetical protein